MKKIYISEKSERLLVQKLMNENMEGESELIETVRNHLDTHYFGGYSDGVKNGKYNPTIIFLVKDNAGNPIKDKPLSKTSVFYELQKEFQNCKTDKKERDKFLWDILTHWYNKDFTKHGNMPS